MTDDDARQRGTLGQRIPTTRKRKKKLNADAPENETRWLLRFNPRQLLERCIVQQMRSDNGNPPHLGYRLDAASHSPLPAPSVTGDNETPALAVISRVALRQSLAGVSQPGGPHLANQALRRHHSVP